MQNWCAFKMSSNGYSDRCAKRLPRATALRLAPSNACHLAGRRDTWVHDCAQCFLVQLSLSLSLLLSQQNTHILQQKANNGQLSQKNLFAARPSSSKSANVSRNRVLLPLLALAPRRNVATGAIILGRTEIIARGGINTRGMAVVVHHRHGLHEQVVVSRSDRLHHTVTHTAHLVQASEHHLSVNACSCYLRYQ